MKLTKYNKSIYVRVSSEDYKTILHNAYGYKNMSDYIRKKLLDCKPIKYNYKTLCNSCVDCKYLEVVGGGVNTYLFALTQ